MKRIIALLLMAVMLFGLCSCADDAAESETEELLVINPEEYGDVTVKIASFIEGDGAQDILKKVAEKYSYDYPNVNIEFQFYNSSDDIENILTSGQDFDAVEVRGENQLRSYVKNSKLAPLTDYINSWDEGYTLTAAAKWAMRSIVEKDENGKKVAVPYMLPYGIYHNALYYRADRISELEVDPENPDALEINSLGIAAPRHWPKLLSTAKAIKELPTNEAEIDIALSGNAADFNFVDTMYWSKLSFEKIDTSAAAYYLYADTEKGEEYGKTIFGTAEAGKVLEYYKRLNDELTVSRFEGEGENAAIEAFINGEANFLIAGPEAVRLCEEGMKDDEWDVVPYPIEEGIYSVLIDDYSAWGITDYSSNKDVAAHFLRYLCNSDNNTYLARECGFIPVHSDAIELDDYFNDSKFWAFTSMGKRTNAYKYAIQPRMYDAYYSGYEDIANAIYSDFLAGKITADEVLANLDAFWTDAFETEGKLW